MSEDREDWLQNQAKELSDKNEILIKCKVTPEFAEKLFEQLYATEKPFEGFNIMQISWDQLILDSSIIDSIIRLLGREPSGGKGDA